MADDLGYSDLGSYGSAIDTPNLDRMARKGLRFTHFYNMAKYNSTRATLLSGLYTRQRHSNNVRTLPQVLSEAGYYTATAGKEHFSGWYPKDRYARHVFDDALVYRAINPYFVPRDGSFPNPFRLNGAKVDPVETSPRDRFYKTDRITDHGRRFLERAGEKERPFFLYMAYHVPHYPLQARKEDIQKYLGAFRQGWDRLRRERFKRQKQMGLLPDHAELSEPEDNVYPHNGSGAWARYDPWEEMPADRRKNLDREMAVYAAMIDRLDQNVGRLMAKLREIGEAGNTLVLFLSDNGACPFDNGGYTGHGDPPFGAPGSYTYQRPEWAAAANTPFRYYKQYGHAGGARTPFFAYWPGHVDEGITDRPAHVVDLMPTLIDAAGADYASSGDRNELPGLDGRSLLPVFRGGSVDDPRLLISGFKPDKRMVRYGKWKIVRVRDGSWELYNLEADPTETTNLAGERPEKVRFIRTKYRSWKKQNSVAKHY